MKRIVTTEEAFVVGLACVCAGIAFTINAWLGLATLCIAAIVAFVARRWL